MREAWIISCYGNQGLGFFTNLSGDAAWDTDIRRSVEYKSHEVALERASALTNARYIEIKKIYRKG